MSDKAKQQAVSDLKQQIADARATLPAQVQGPVNSPRMLLQASSGALAIPLVPGKGDSRSQ
jgi:hypothetical protein